ncbi:MAG: ABC transporter substrate-binding protein [Clostridia bacterium]|nr:ABC transporter substrate-binding protein [Clostridia bacterium]
MKKLVSLALVFVLLLSLTGLAMAEDEKSVNIGVTSTLTTLNPLACDNTEVVKYAVSLVFLPLVELNAELEFVPQLASSITTEDNLTFTIKLQEGAKWSDGEPVTAQDVAFTLAIGADPVSANIALPLYAVEGTDDDGFIESGAKEISGVKVIDDKTLTVSLKWPTALYTFENNFGRYLFPVPEHVLKDVAREELLTYAWFNKPDVISGPYFITEADLQHYVHYQANPDYFLGAPKIKYLNINVVAAAQMLAGLRSGEIDLVQQTMGSIPVEDYDAVRALTGVTAVTGTPITNESIFINTAKVPDVRIRQALLYGMDRQSMFEALLNGNGEVIDGFLVSASPYYSAELGVTAYDPEKAAALIAEAKADGANTNLTWYVNSSESTFNQAVEYYAALFDEMGLHIDIRTVSLANLMEVATNGEHDIMSVEYTYAPVDPYTDVAWLLGGEGSWTGYATVETDAALALSQELTDVDAITAQYLIVDRAMQEDAAMISGWVIATLGAVNDRLTGVTPNVFGTFISVQNWDIK